MDDLKLPKTKLALADGVIRKLGDDDAILATFQLDDVTDIRCEEFADYPFPLLLIASFGGLSVVANMFIPVRGLAWATSIICGAIALFGIAIINGHKIVIETPNGTVGYTVVDDRDEAIGFVMSVNQRLQSDS